MKPAAATAISVAPLRTAPEVAAWCPVAVVVVIVWTSFDRVEAGRGNPEQALGRSGTDRMGHLDDDWPVPAVRAEDVEGVAAERPQEDLHPHAHGAGPAAGRSPRRYARPPASRRGRPAAPTRPAACGPPPRPRARRPGSTPRRHEGAPAPGRPCGPAPSPCRRRRRRTRWGSPAPPTPPQARPARPGRRPRALASTVPPTARRRAAARGRSAARRQRRGRVRR